MKTYQLSNCINILCFEICRVSGMALPHTFILMEVKKKQLTLTVMKMDLQQFIFQGEFFIKSSTFSHSEINLIFLVVKKKNVIMKMAC